MVSLGDLLEEAQELLATVPQVAGSNDRPVATSNAANRVVVPWRTLSYTDGTIAFCGGFRYRSTTSRTLASSSGTIMQNFNVSARQGCRPHVRQILPTHACEIPTRRPVDEQWVTPAAAATPASPTQLRPRRSWPAIPAWVDRPIRRSAWCYTTSSSRSPSAWTVAAGPGVRASSRSCFGLPRRYRGRLNCLRGELARPREQEYRLVAEQVLLHTPGRALQRWA